MVIWLALIIPIAAVVYLSKYYPKQIVPWEIALLLGVGLVAVISSKSLAETIPTVDTEYWGGWVTRAEYYEDWDELVPCSHTKYCTESYTDSNGKSATREVPCGVLHPAGDESYHPAYWQIIDSNGITIGVSQSQFKYLVGRFGGAQFIDLHRSYYSNDGDMYATSWPGTRETLESCTTKHEYVNKVQASKSIHNFRPVSKREKKLYALYDYPEVSGYYMTAILGRGGPTTATANEELQKLNALLGAKKQVRMFILIFRNQPREAGLSQEDLWKGGNKNEFILTIGVDDQNHVTWCHPISWTKVEELKVTARNFVEEQETLDLNAVVAWIGGNVEQKFVRRPFKEFNYLTIEPPAWTVWVSFVFVGLLTAGISWFVVTNDANDYSEPHRYRGKYRSPRFPYK